jgi:hypothetical protein
MSKLIRNAIQTPDGTILESLSRHDYKDYTDANGKTYMVDGGLAYVRRSAHGDEVDLCLHDDEPHAVQRHIVKWGSYGINGDQPLKYKSVADMDTAHIEAVLAECFPSPVIKECMQHELVLRGRFFKIFGFDMLELAPPDEDWIQMCKDWKSMV